MRPVGSVGIRKVRRRRETGAALTEFAFILLPTMGLLFLLMNLAWIVFAWACIQEATREGVRSAITCSPAAGLNAAVQQVVQQYSFGFINAQNYPSVVTVKYYSPTTLALISGQVTSGTVVKVSVSGLKLNIFTPILASASPIYLGSTSADIMACTSPATP